MLRASHLVPGIMDPLNKERDIFERFQDYQAKYNIIVLEVVGALTVSRGMTVTPGIINTRVPLECAC